MKRSRFCAIAMFWLLLLSAGYAQAQMKTTSTESADSAKAGARLRANTFLFNLPQLVATSHFSFGPALQTNSSGRIRIAAKIGGGGTQGKIPVFTDENHLGDSIMTEASGNISISGALTTNGAITTNGGIRFPDGTLQTTAATGGGGGGGGLTLPFSASVSLSSTAFRVVNQTGIAIFGGSTGSIGVNGVSTSNIGVRGLSDTSFGVFGTSGGGEGVHGETRSGLSDGVVGISGGNGNGVSGKTGSSAAAGVFGENTSSNGKGLWGQSNGSSGTGVFGEGGLIGGDFAGGPVDGFGFGVRAIGGIGVQGISGSLGFLGTGRAGVLGGSNDRDGVRGISNKANGVLGLSASSPAFLASVVATFQAGIIGASENANGAVATNRSNFAALFAQNDGAGHGISGVSSGIGVAVRGEAKGNGLAGGFVGNVMVTGNLSKGGGSFKIDHPLDPENKYLYHSFVESPDMMNIYNGNVTTDETGDAVITLPDYFEALNRDFRYQLTVIGTFAQAIVGTKIKDNRFTIKTNGPNVEVSWQVTGIRKDPYADKHRIPVEEAKSEQERGYYLHPDTYGQPQEKSIEWAREPEPVREMRKAMIDSGVSPKTLPPPGSGASIAPERSIKQQ